MKSFLKAAYKAVNEGGNNNNNNNRNYQQQQQQQQLWITPQNHAPSLYAPGAHQQNFPPTLEQGVITTHSGQWPQQAQRTQTDIPHGGYGNQFERNDQYQPPGLSPGQQQQLMPSGAPSVPYQQFPYPPTSRPASPYFPPPPTMTTRARSPAPPPLPPPQLPQRRVQSFGAAGGYNPAVLSRPGLETQVHSDSSVPSLTHPLDRSVLVDPSSLQPSTSLPLIQLPTQTLVSTTQTPTPPPPPYSLTQSPPPNPPIPSLQAQPSPSPSPQPAYSATTGKNSSHAEHYEPQRIIKSQSGGGGPRVIKVLSLDGGGVRGLSEIFILKYIMRLLGRARGFELQPWQEFDIIGGTSTGGLLAIMLGRLRMTLKECEDAYLTMSRDIFEPVRNKSNFVARANDFLQANGRFKSGSLENSIKRILRGRGLSEDELLQDEREDSCKIFVCAVREDGSRAVIRSYETEAHDSLYETCKIWEGARATSAASTFFDPITVGPYGQKFVDGALRHNNPIDLVDLESKALWEEEDRIIVSIGTGIAPAGDVTGNLKELGEALIKLVTDTEERNNVFRQRNRAMVEQGLLYRFNVNQGLGSVGLEEHKAVNLIRTFTDGYLQDPDVQSSVKRCAKIMKDGGQRLNYVGPEDLAAHLERMRLNQVMCVSCGHCLRGVPFGSVYFYCVECRVDICSTCHSDHNYEHTNKLLRFEGTQWSAHMKDAVSSRECNHCSRDAQSRIECRRGDCGASLCTECWEIDDRRIEFLKSHQEENNKHRSFLTVFPPFFFVVDRINPSCRCSTTPECIGHCSRCASPCVLYDTLYYCRTCRLDSPSSSVQLLCTRCFQTNEPPAHKTAHSFQSLHFLFENPPHDETEYQDLVDFEKRAFRCPECPGEFMSYAQTVLHPHSELQFFRTPAFLEISHINAVKECPVFACRVQPSVTRDVATLVKCMFCKSYLAYEEELALCTTAGCWCAFCLRCVSGNRVRHRHRHALVQVRFKKAVASNHSCDYCGADLSKFIGMQCADCLNHDMCQACVIKCTEGKLGSAALGTHQGCQGNGTRWLYYRADEAPKT
ncbi:MAG: hypothetical protein M1834_000499 [Cirrosporium novae-zelandiae]|nr:MAG: hypothetical protein M1834_000499 [Cirrosporium novae-zelandiae]